jgi:GrpB-like predicted nucleotidyltransferase (UPF0157 family)
LFYNVIKKLPLVESQMKEERISEVKLTPYNKNWPQQFAAEAKLLEPILGKHNEGIFHIGSTSIEGCYAKSTIDIIIMVDNLDDIETLNPEFEKLDYHCMGEYGIKDRRFYWKGPKSGHTFHIHLFPLWHSEVIRHLTFSSFVNEHPELVNSYSWIKRCLAEQFPKDIEQYVNGKESFVRMIDYRGGFSKKDQLTAEDVISLEEYNPHWPALATAEINAIKRTIDLPYSAIEHCGSTAIADIMAKPVIDIFIALDNMDNAAQWVKPLENLGYLFCYGNPEDDHLRFFKGIPPCGNKRTHHIHILPAGDDFNKRTAFRDKLNQDQNLRIKYETLKIELAEKYRNDREAYTDKKADFIHSLDL